MSSFATRVDLSGRRALITGASSGLGAHFAQTLSMAGASVVLAARRRNRLETLASTISDAGGDVIVIEMDVTSPASVDAGFAAIAADGGSVCDIIVNNSGVGQNSQFLETSEAEWRSVIDTNLTGVWRVAKAAAAAIVDAQKPGSIVNIASVLALRPSAGVGGYAASKAAVDHLTRNMATELARHQIRVNAIAPGYFSTELNKSFLASAIGLKMMKRIPLRRFGNYDELDAPLLLLASDAGSFMTGSTIVVDGGHSLSPL